MLIFFKLSAVAIPSRKGSGYTGATPALDTPTELFEKGEWNIPMPGNTFPYEPLAICCGCAFIKAGDVPICGCEPMYA